MSCTGYISGNTVNHELESQPEHDEPEKAALGLHPVSNDLTEFELEVESPANGEGKSLETQSGDSTRAEMLETHPLRSLLEASKPRWSDR